MIQSSYFPRVSGGNNLRTATPGYLFSVPELCYSCVESIFESARKNKTNQIKSGARSSDMKRKYIEIALGENLRVYTQALLSLFLLRFHFLKNESLIYPDCNPPRFYNRVTPKILSKYTRKKRV